MLAGAIVIIVQAPRCKPIPEMNWWNEGPLYQISDLNEFSENGLKGDCFFVLIIETQMGKHLVNLSQLFTYLITVSEIHKFATVTLGQP